MTTLSSLIVARRAASIAEVDEALARQVVRGGDLGTCLLELGLVEERELVALAAEAYGRESAGDGELPAAPAEVLRLVPRAVALRHGIYPLEERDGELLVAVAEPLPQAVEDDLGFALGANLRQFVAPLVRIRQAISRDYGLPLDRRFSRLLAKLEHRPDPSPSDTPPRPEQTPPFPGGGVKLSKSGTMIAEGVVPAPPKVPEQVPAVASPQRIVAPARRNTWPGMVFTPQGDGANAPISEPAQTLPMVPDEVATPRPAGVTSARTLASPPKEPASRAGPVASPEPPVSSPPPTPPIASLEPLASPRRPTPLVASPEPPVSSARPTPRVASPAAAPSPNTSPAASPDSPTAAELASAEAPPASDPETERRPSPAPPHGFVLEAMAVTAAQVEKKRRRRAEQASGKALLGWARRTLGNVIPADRSPERKRGPFTASAAEQKLEEATTAEQSLAVFFAFARQYFEYSALFMVHGDLAAGHDGWGPGATGEKVRAIGVALDLPSALSHAKTRGTPALVQLKRVGLDADLRVDLARPGSHEVLVLPVMMRGRCVALLYGDDGDKPVDYGDVGDVVAMASLLSTILERILLRKKRAKLRDPSAVKSKLQAGVDRSEMRVGDRRGASASKPPGDLSNLAGKRGARAEEDLLDAGWILPDSDSKMRVRPSAPPPAKNAPPPAPQPAPARPVAKQSARRKEIDDTPPELIISESEDVSSMNELLSELEDNPSPPTPRNVRSAPERGSVQRLRDPMASTSISAGPHPPPPPSQGPFRILPSVLIRSDLVDQVVAGGERAERALGEILALGEAAIPSVFARFPGPLTVDRNQALGELPRPADCGPVLRVVAAMRRLALPFLAVRSGDIDVDVRFWATYLLGELNYADAATALVPRLFDENPTVRRIAVRSARSILASGEEGAPLRKALERAVSGSEEPLQRRLTALATIGELKLYRSIPALIESLGDRNEGFVDAAARTLTTMTRQELGREKRKWHDWWESKGKKRLI
jgi:hypothetical protein